MSQNNASRLLFVKNIAHKTKGDDLWCVELARLLYSQLSTSCHVQGSVWEIWTYKTDSIRQCRKYQRDGFRGASALVKYALFGLILSEYAQVYEELADVRLCTMQSEMRGSF